MLPGWVLPDVMLVGQLPHFLRVAGHIAVHPWGYGEGLGFPGPKAVREVVYAGLQQ